MGKRTFALWTTTVSVFIAGFAMGYIASPERPAAIPPAQEIRERNSHIEPRKRDTSALPTSPEADGTHTRTHTNNISPAGDADIPVFSAKPSVNHALPPTDTTGSPTDDQEMQRLRHLDALHQAEKGEKQLSRLQEHFNADAGTAISQAFQQETIDNEWAYARETQLREVLANTATLAGVPLVETECRQQQCRVSVLSSDETTAFTTIAQLYQHTNTSNEWEGYYTVSDPVTGVTEIYLQRK